MARLLDWEFMQSIDEGGNVIVALSSLEVLFLQACSSFYQSRYSWVYGANDVTDEQWNAIQYLQAQTEVSLMGNMVGLILPNILADITNLGVLECDGTTHLRVDYPLLYDAISSNFIIDADSFFVPDLREKFPMGASLTNPIGATGGEEEVQLAVANLPSHDHPSAPHSHGVNGAIASTVLVNAGVPVPSALPLVGTTSPASAIIGFTGNDTPHNNIPPFTTVSYVIVSG